MKEGGGGGGGRRRPCAQKKKKKKKASAHGYSFLSQVKICRSWISMHYKGTAGVCVCVWGGGGGGLLLKEQVDTTDNIRT